MLPRFDQCFDLAKVQEIAPLLERAVKELHALKPVELPPVQCMSHAEVIAGEMRGGGHGLFEHETGAVKVNPAMEPLAIYLNFIHEHLHRLFPEMAHAGIRVLTALVDCRARNLGGETCDILETLEERGRD